LIRTQFVPAATNLRTHARSVAADVGKVTMIGIGRPLSTPSNASALRFNIREPLEKSRAEGRAGNSSCGSPAIAASVAMTASSVAST
jgi:hypothetical protein